MPRADTAWSGRWVASVRPGTTQQWRVLELLKDNVLDRWQQATRGELRIAIVTWIERTYHRRRRQSGPGSVEPDRVRDHHDLLGRPDRVT